MQGPEARSPSGCWRRTVLLLSCVWVLYWVPLSAHAVRTNTTELDATANDTSPLNVEEGPSRVNDVIVTVTEVGTLVSPNTVDSVTLRAGRVPRAGEEEEQSSGMLGETVFPALEEVGVAAPPQLSPDSAETEHLLPSNPHKQEVMEGEEEEDEEHLPLTEAPWIDTKDTTVLDLDRLPGNMITTTPPPSANPSHPDVLHVDFFDPSSRGGGLDLAPPSPSSLAHELQGGDPTSWAMPDNYDYLTPYEDGMSPTADEYSYSTTTDTYGGDDDIKLSASSPARPRPRVPESTFNLDAVMPGGDASVPDGPAAAPLPAELPVELPVDGSDGMGGCRIGFQMSNGSCRSPCDTLPSYCFNGGQCYLLEGMGVVCRCNVQDYIWHKGARCESVVTEFQVMCLAVGASALVVLLLFMIVVCFAKKLHVLKTENNRLRKRSKYRPASEQHNDNFSLSTIAEGSHPNKTMSRYTWECKTKEESDCEDDPNSQNKLEDPLKAPPKEDDSLNIHNSLTPKHENHKVLGEENSSEVNSLQNNMM